MRPDLDIIVVTYNSAHVVGELLDSLPAALDGLIADIVVVDNGSVDGTAELVADRGDCRLVLSENLGYAAGINRGITEAAPADAILVLNPDVVMQAGSVPPLLYALKEPGVGIVVPQIRTRNGALQMSLRREPTILRALGLTWTHSAVLSEYVLERSAYTCPSVVDWAVGAAMLMSRTCYDIVNGWDESYFLYSEETDLSLRARDVGLVTRYEPRSVVVHLEGQSGRTDATHAMQIVNRVRLYRRRKGVAAAWCYYCLTIASEFSWVLRGQRQSRFAIKALLRPSLRPPQLRCADRLLPG